MCGKYRIEMEDELVNICQRETIEIADDFITFRDDFNLAQQELANIIGRINRTQASEEECLELWDALWNSPRTCDIDHERQQHFISLLRRIKFTPLDEASPPLQLKPEFCGKDVGIVFGLREDRTVGYNTIVKFNYSPGIMARVTEKDFFAMRNFSLQERYSLQVVSSAFPKHIGTEFMDGRYPPLEFATIRPVGRDWGIDTDRDVFYEEGELFVDCRSEPTNYDFKPDEQNNLCRNESSQQKPVPGYGCSVLTTFGTNRLFGLDSSNNVFLGMWEKRNILPIFANRDTLYRYHFGVFGITGSGKSNFVVHLVRQFFDTQPENAKAVIFDVSSEYSGWLMDYLSDGRALLVMTDTEDLESLQHRFMDVRWPILPDDTKEMIEEMHEDQRLRLFQQIQPNIQVLLQYHIDNEWFFSAITNKLIEICNNTLEFSTANPNSASSASSRISRACSQERENMLNAAFQIDDFTNDDEVIEHIIQFITHVLDNITRYLGGLRDNQIAGYHRILEEVIVRIRGFNNEAYVRSRFSSIIRDIRVNKEMENIITIEDLLCDLSSEQGHQLLIIDGSPDIIRGALVDILDRKLQERMRGTDQNDSPVFFLIDEAHNFAPRGESINEEMKRSSAAIESVVRQGRKYEIGVGLSSQRVRYLNTSIMSQLNTWFVGQMTYPSDREAIAMTYGISDAIMRQVLYFPVGRWLCSSTRALGPRMIPVVVRAPHSEAEYLFTFIDNYLQQPPSQNGTPPGGEQPDENRAENGE